MMGKLRLKEVEKGVYTLKESRRRPIVKLKLERDSPSE